MAATIATHHVAATGSTSTRNHVFARITHSSVVAKRAVGAIRVTRTLSTIPWNRRANFLGESLDDDATPTGPQLASTAAALAGEGVPPRPAGSAAARAGAAGVPPRPAGSAVVPAADSIPVIVEVAPGGTSTARISLTISVALALIAAAISRILSVTLTATAGAVHPVVVAVVCLGCVWQQQQGQQGQQQGCPSPPSPSPSLPSLPSPTSPSPPSTPWPSSRP